MADQIDRSTIGLFAMLDFQMYIYFGVESHDDSLCFQIYVGNTVCKISVLVVHLIHVSFLTFNTKRQETVKRISGYQTKEPTQSTKMRRVLTNRLLFKVLCFFAPLSDCPIPPFSQTPKYVHLFRWSFARALQCAAIPEIQIDTVRQLLCVQIWDVWSMKGGKWKAFDLYSRIIIRF